MCDQVASNLVFYEMTKHIECNCQETNTPRRHCHKFIKSNDQLPYIFTNSQENYIRGKLRRKFYEDNELGIHDLYGPV